MTKPKWWTDQHTSSWERVKEALRRDWEQTKHDFSDKHGHELNQDVGDTVKQAAGKEAIPPNDRANPPRVIGSWDDVEYPIGYGYGARLTYGQRHASWNDDVERELAKDWDDTPGNGKQPWDRVKPWVMRGWNYRA